MAFKQPIPVSNAPSCDQAETEPLIEFHNVAMTLDHTTVLKDVSFHVCRREVAALVGPTGAGKSTILRIIAGLLAPDSGDVIVRSDKIGMAFQYSALLSSLTVFENVALPLIKTTKLSYPEIEKRVHEKLALVGMDDGTHHLPEALSGGMKKRVSLARALVIEPDIILYDEPSSGLDPMTATKLENDMREISQKVGAASVLVTHDLGAVNLMSDRVLMLYQGSIVWSGSRVEFFNCDNPYPVQYRQQSVNGPFKV